MRRTRGSYSTRATWSPCWRTMNIRTRTWGKHLTGWSTTTAGSRPIYEGLRPVHSKVLTRSCDNTSKGSTSRSRSTWQENLPSLTIATAGNSSTSWYLNWNPPSKMELQDSMMERLQSSWIASKVNQMSLQEWTNWRRNWSRWRRSNAHFAKRKAMKQIIKTMLKLRMTWSYLTWTKLCSYPHSRTWDMGTRWSCPTEHARSPWMNQTCHRGVRIVQKDRKGNRRWRREM